MKVNNEGFLEKKTSARKGDNKHTSRDWWMVKQHIGKPGGIVNLGTLSLPKRYVGKKIMIRVIDKEARTGKNQKMVWEKLEKGSYENKFPNKYDFSITKERKKYTLDIFDAKIKDSDQAYIETKGNLTLVEAKKEAKDYEREN